jgi:HPt (histidine-containing phosphotransfer) domain-containing protein
MVSGYLNDCRKDLPALHAAVAIGDYQRAKVFGHQMKGTGGPYGFPSLTRFGSEIEQAAVRENALELQNQIDQLGEYLGRVELACE